MEGSASGSQAYLDEVQHGEGEALVAEAAVHHHLDECWQGARQLSQGKHDLAVMAKCEHFPRFG